MWPWTRILLPLQGFCLRRNIGGFSMLRWKDDSEGETISNPTLLCFSASTLRLDVFARGKRGHLSASQLRSSWSVQCRSVGKRGSVALHNDQADNPSFSRPAWKRQSTLRIFYLRKKKCFYSLVDQFVFAVPAFVGQQELVLELRRVNVELLLVALRGYQLYQGTSGLYLWNLQGTMENCQKFLTK